MRKLVTAVLSLLLVMTWSQAAVAQTRTPPPEELVAVLDGWEEAFNAGDAAGVTAVYAEDAARMPPLGDFQMGHEAITADLANYEGMTIELRMLGGVVEGNLAASWGAYRLEGTGPDGAAVEMTGRWMNNYKKTDAGWKIYRDIWNFGPDGQPDWME